MRGGFKMLPCEKKMMKEADELFQECEELIKKLRQEEQ
jgi:hypothetical protein